MREVRGSALAALLLLCAATPPAWFAGAEWLVIPGLMAFYSFITRASRPYLAVYLVVSAHALYFSWSLRHTILAGWAAIGLLAGLYGMLLVHVARRLTPGLRGPLSFAVALALTQWLRAHMVQFPYPHGQPAHSLYAWPELLTVVRWGGEPLANAFLAGIAAAFVDLYRSWRVAEPSWKSATRRAALWVSGTVLLTAFPPPRAADPDQEMVRIVSVEPGLEAEMVFGADAWRSMLPRLVEATERIPESDSAPDLVLWPESSFPAWVARGALQELPDVILPQPRLPDGTRLLVGAFVLADERRLTPASVLLADRGRYIAHQEKITPVPAGERLPFLGWFLDLLPDSLRLPILNSLLDIGVPMGLAGQWLAPLQTDSGIPFGSLLCFDNAFETVATRHVENGARFLVVLSNEAWYRGGGELEQLVAMTVFRALETGTPIVRCTVDGVSLAVDRRGRVLARLADRDRAVPPEAGILDVTLDAGPGRLSPLAWLSDAFLWAVLACGALVLLHRLLSCARLIKTPPVVAASAVPPAPRDPFEGGS